MRFVSGAGLHNDSTRAACPTQGTLRIDQDAAIYLSSLRSGQQVTHTTDAKRKAYAFVTQGEVTLNGQKLVAGDQARIADESTLAFAASKDTELILLDLPE